MLGPRPASLKKFARKSVVQNPNRKSSLGDILALPNLSSFKNEFELGGEYEMNKLF